MFGKKIAVKANITFFQRPDCTLKEFWCKKINKQTEDHFMRGSLKDMESLARVSWELNYLFMATP